MKVPTTATALALALGLGREISARTRTHCLLEELVQVLGLPNDPCRYRPSLFCEDDFVTQLTAVDRILIQALYDPRLATGQPRDEALATVETIVADLVQPAAVR